MELTETEVKDARIIMVYFWGQQASNWNVTPKTLNVIGKIMTEASTCSRAMDFVPRPGMPLNAGYVRKQLKDIVRRIRGNSGMYAICKSTIARTYKTEIVLSQ